MTNIFQLVAERLSELGFYNFLLPFILFTTVLYAVLRKTQILGESPVIHGIISVAVGLFVFGTPVILGVTIAPSLTAFVIQGVIFILVLLFGFLIASFFYPNIVEKLPEIFKGGGPAAWFVWATVGIGGAAGLFVLIQDPVRKAIAALKVPGELMTMAAVIIIIFVVFLLIAMAGGKEVK